MPSTTFEEIGATYELTDPRDIGRKMFELQYSHDQQEHRDLVKATLPQLMDELSSAHAPFSGKETACLIMTTKSVYGGYAYEHGPGNFETAEAMALAKIPPDDTELRSIFVTGKGDIKPKHAMPSHSAYDAIRERFAVPEGTHKHHPLKMYLIAPNSCDHFEQFDYWGLNSAYEPRRFSALAGFGGRDTIAEILDYTNLSEYDARFLAYLREVGQQEKIQFHLTGSAAAHGGVSVVINDSYDDLDIIAISDIDKEKAEAIFEAHATEFYGPLEKTAKTIRILTESRDVHGAVFKNDRVSIDFFAARRIEDAVVRPETLQKNFFHRLS